MSSGNFKFWLGRQLRQQQHARQREERTNSFTFEVDNPANASLNMYINQQQFSSSASLLSSSYTSNLNRILMPDGSIDMQLFVEEQTRMNHEILSRLNNLTEANRDILSKVSTLEVKSLEAIEHVMKTSDLRNPIRIEDASTFTDVDFDSILANCNGGGGSSTVGIHDETNVHSNSNSNMTDKSTCVLCYYYTTMNAAQAIIQKCELPSKVLSSLSSSSSSTTTTTMIAGPPPPPPSLHGIPLSLMGPNLRGSQQVVEMQRKYGSWSYEATHQGEVSL
jgi:hypothetical protein